MQLLHCENIVAPVQPAPNVLRRSARSRRPGRTARPLPISDSDGLQAPFTTLAPMDQPNGVNRAQGLRRALPEACPAAVSETLAEASLARPNSWMNWRVLVLHGEACSSRCGLPFTVWCG